MSWVRATTTSRHFPYAVDHPALPVSHLGREPALVLGRSLDPAGKPADLVVDVVAGEVERLTEEVGDCRLAGAGDPVHEDPSRAAKILGGGNGHEPSLGGVALSCRARLPVSHGLWANLHTPRRIWCGGCRDTKGPW